MHLRALISDLHWQVQMLDTEIQEAERQANNPIKQPHLLLALGDRRTNRRDGDGASQRKCRRIRRAPSFDLRLARCTS